MPSSRRKKIPGQPNQNKSLFVAGEKKIPWKSWIILSVGLIISFLVWDFSAQFFQEGEQDRFQEKAEQIYMAIKQRMQDYEQVLHGGQGLFSASSSVERSEWKAFVETQEIQERFPGIQGIGYSKRVGDKTELEKHIAEMHAEGFPTFTVRPETERPEYHSIIYLEPFDKRNQQAFGFDMFSEPTRRAAMEQARDTGEPIMSGKVTLVQEIDADVQAGFLMYLPVYTNGVSHTTVDERRANLQGFVYSPFRMNDLMRGILGATAPDVNFIIYDTVDTPENLMYDDNHVRNISENSQKGSFTTQKILSFYGRNWLLTFQARKSFSNGLIQWEPILIALLGAVLSTLLFLIFSSTDQLRLQAQELAQKITKDLQKSEEQLRFFVDHTPAAVAMFDTDMNYILASQRWTQDYELEGKDILGKNHFKLVNFLPKEWKKIQDVCLKGEIKKCEEVTFKRPDGRKEYMRCEAYPWIDHDGKIKGIIMFSEIITAQRNYNQQLKDRTQELERLNRTMVNRELKMIELKNKLKTAKK